MRKETEIKALKRQVEECEAETEKAQRQLRSVEMEKDQATIASASLKKDYDDLNFRLGTCFDEDVHTSHADPKKRHGR
jgi:predicted nuclease with TOPRIM domain